MSFFKSCMNMAPEARCSEVIRNCNCMLFSGSFAKEDFAHNRNGRIGETHRLFPGVREWVFNFCGQFIRPGGSRIDQCQQLCWRQISKLSEDTPRFAQGMLAQSADGI